MSGIIRYNVDFDPCSTPKRPLMQMPFQASKPDYAPTPVNMRCWKNRVLHRRCYEPEAKVGRLQEPLYESRDSCRGKDRCTLIAFLFGGLIGDSCSSSLPVRSITGAGRLLVDRAEDCSRDPAGVCCNKPNKGRDSCFTGVTPGSLISISSSSSLAGVTSPGPAAAGSFLGFVHCPPGSIMTCSTSNGVERSISSTYLYDQIRLNTR